MRRENNVVDDAPALRIGATCLDRTGISIRAEDRDWRRGQCTGFRVADECAPCQRIVFRPSHERELATNARGDATRDQRAFDGNRS
jgi:hypothetical protein